MMTDIEIKLARALASRIISGFREMIPEQRRAIMTEVMKVYCATCGGDDSSCKCFITLIGGTMTVIGGLKEVEP